MPINLKTNWKIILAIGLIFIAVLIVLLVLNLNTGKAEKVLSNEILFPKMLSNNIIRYYSPDKKAIVQTTLQTDDKKTLLKIDDEAVFSILWSPAGDEAVINKGTNDLTVDKYWYYSVKKKMLIQFDENASDFSWSPLGKIAYIYNGEDLTINISEADGTDFKQIYSLGENYGASEIDLSWSNDSKHIAVSVGGTDVGPTEAFILDIETKKRSLASKEPTGKVGQWSPDSKSLLFQLFQTWNSQYSWAVKNIQESTQKSLWFDGEIIWLTDSQTLIGLNQNGVWKINAKNTRKTNIYRPNPKENIVIDQIIKYEESEKILYFLSNNNLYKVKTKR